MPKRTDNLAATFRLPRATIDALDEEHARTGMTKSAIVDRALQDRFRNRKNSGENTEGDPGESSEVIV